MIITQLSKIKLQCTTHQKTTFKMHHHALQAKLVCGFVLIHVDSHLRNGGMIACAPITVTCAPNQIRNMLNASIDLATLIALPESGNANYRTERLCLNKQASMLTIGKLKGILMVYLNIKNMLLTSHCS